MKRIMLVVLVLGIVSQFALQNVNAVEPIPQKFKLLKAFIQKLKENSPFTYEDEIRFFGKKSACSYVILWRLGYLDEKGRWLKPKPKYSYLGELIRINSDKLHLKDYKSIRYLIGDEFMHCNGRGQYDAETNKILFTKEAYYRKKKFSTSLICILSGRDASALMLDVELISILFRKQSRKLDFPIYVNGKSFMKMLGFESRPQTLKGILPAPVLKKEVLTQLAKHVESLSLCDKK